MIENYLWLLSVVAAFLIGRIAVSRQHYLAMRKIQALENALRKERDKILMLEHKVKNIRRGIVAVGGARWRDAP